MIRFCFLLIASVTVTCSVLHGDQEFEFCNNFLMNLSFITGTDQGMAQNLDDNLGWMQDQGYTHLRFFGIFPNGIHCFPSPTLDANSFPNSPYHEQVLELLVSKAQQHGIVVNFDGWETIAESNYDTTVLGVNFISEEELGLIVQEVLSLGVELVSEEQFGSGYIQAIQSACSSAGAVHETTSPLWWQSSSASTIADAQLANVFCFYPRSHEEADSLIAAGHGYDIPSTLGTLHFILESSKYFGIPTSLAVGSFGTLEPENWRNVLRFAQLQHRPNRFSIEESNTDLTIWNPGFNFMNYVGDELLLMADSSAEERPIANLVLDLSSLYMPTFIPVWYALLVDAPAVVNTFTSQGYRVVATVDSVLPEAQIYYVLLAGGASYPNVSELPDYVMPLIQDSVTVFLHPVYGIPDDNDEASWIPLRAFFGLPGGDTETLADAIPENVSVDGYDVKWCGIDLYLTPCIEYLPASQIDTAGKIVALAGQVGETEIALVIQRDNKFLVNSNLVNLEASFVMSTLLSGRINGPALADIAIANDRAMIFAEYDSQVDIDLPWSGVTHMVHYDPQGYLLAEADTMTAGAFSRFVQRGELLILSGSAEPPFICGDADGSGDIDIDDVVYLINYIFAGGPEPSPYEAGDADCSSGVDIDDVVYTVQYIFSGGSEPCDPDGDGIPDC
jgi:hypothetical protein